MNLKAKETRYINVEVENREIWETVERAVIKRVPELAKLGMDSFFFQDGKPYGTEEDSRGNIDHTELKLSKKAVTVLRALDIIEKLFLKNE